MKNREIILTLVALLYVNALAHASPNFTDTLNFGKEKILNAVSNCEVCEFFPVIDKKNRENIWSAFDEHSYHFSQAYKAVVFNDSDFDKWYLKVNGVDELRIYNLSDSSVKAGGKLIYGSQQSIFRPNELDAIVPLSLSPGMNTLYFHAKSRMEISGSPSEFSIVSELIWLKGNQDQIPYFELLLIGSSLVLFTFNLLIFFQSKDKSHLFYCLYILLGLIIIVNKVGLLPHWLYFPYSIYYYNEIGLTGITVTFILFMQSFLQTRSFIPYWHRGGIILACFAIIKVFGNFILIMINQVNLSIVISNVSLGFILLYLLASIFVVQKKKNPLTRYFTLGASSLFIGFTIFLIDAFYNSMDVEVGYFFGKIGTILEIIFFAMGLGYKIRRNQLEKEKTQAKLIGQLKENRELQFKHTLNLERKVSERTEALNRVNESKSRLFANISHDLRTPIMLINGYLENIRQIWYDKLPEELINDCNGIEKNSQKIAYLTDEIHELIQLEAGSVKLNLRPFKLNNYLRLICRLFEGAAASKKIELIFHDLIKRDAIIDIDPEKFEKIMYNLVSNALKFTNKGGEIEISLFLSRNKVGISIADNGIGMDQETIQLIYDRYFQADHNKYQVEQGLGIGLSIVKETVELHKGEITVQSEPGKGSVFTMTFPESNSKLFDEAAVPDFLIARPFLTEGEEHSHKAVVNSTLNSNNKVPVLIVDDHSEIRAYLKALLQETYFILEAENGEGALSVLKSHQVKLIITDLMMPVIDGFQLLELLNANNRLREIPVMVVSARHSITDRELALSQGIEDYLIKPFGSREFLARVDNILNRSTDKLPPAFQNYDLGLAEQKMLKQIQDFIVSHVDRQISANMLADELAMSVRTFQRTMKKLTNSTPLEYIKEVKFNYIHELIETRKVRSMNDAARAIGLSNVTRFKEAYKRRFGEVVMVEV